MSRLVIHRNILGKEHEMTDDCWCDPMVVEDGDLRTTGQIVEESDKRDLRQ